MTEHLNPPLSDFSTQAARADELRRRKLRRELLADWQATRQALADESVAAVRAISDDEWARALEQDEGDADV